MTATPQTPTGPEPTRDPATTATAGSAPATDPTAAAMTTAMTTGRAAELARDVLASVSRAVVGNTAELELVLAGILAGGHVLLEDYPGLGKTLAARSFAQALGLDFARAQFTPDLLPSDLTGSFLYDQRRAEFTFRRGPVFTGLLLADEINRTPPKTQAALLEAMQEHQVTLEGTTFPLPRPFHVIATANPVEHEGTYQLPEAQLDRFLMRLSFGYPAPEDEWDVVARRVARRTEDQTVPAVTDAAGLLAAQAAVEAVDVDASVGRYAVALAAATREHAAAEMGASPRGSLALVTVARALAVIRGRDYVTPEDVKHVAVPVLAHRISIKPELWMTAVSGADVVREALETVSVPGARE